MLARQWRCFTAALSIYIFIHQQFSANKSTTPTHTQTHTTVVFLLIDSGAVSVNKSIKNELSFLFWKCISIVTTLPYHCAVKVSQYSGKSCTRTFKMANTKATSPPHRDSGLLGLCTAMLGSICAGKLGAWQPPPIRPIHPIHPSLFLQDQPAPTSALSFSPPDHNQFHPASFHVRSGSAFGIRCCCLIQWQHDA